MYKTLISKSATILIVGIATLTITGCSPESQNGASAISSGDTTLQGTHTETGTVYAFTGDMTVSWNSEEAHSYVKITSATIEVEGQTYNAVVSGGLDIPDKATQIVIPYSFVKELPSSNNQRKAIVKIKYVLDNEFSGDAVVSYVLEGGVLTPVIEQAANVDINMEGGAVNVPVKVTFPTEDGTSGSPMQNKVVQWKVINNEFIDGSSDGYFITGDDGIGYIPLTVTKNETGSDRTIQVAIQYENSSTVIDLVQNFSKYSVAQSIETLPEAQSEGGIYSLPITVTETITSDSGDTIVPVNNIPVVWEVVDTQYVSAPTTGTVTTNEQGVSRINLNLIANDLYETRTINVIVSVGNTTVSIPVTQKAKEYGNYTITPSENAPTSTAGGEADTVTLVAMVTENKNVEGTDTSFPVINQPVTFTIISGEGTFAGGSRTYTVNSATGGVITANVSLPKNETDAINSVVVVMTTPEGNAESSFTITQPAIDPSENIQLGVTDMTVDASGEQIIISGNVIDTNGAPVSGTQINYVVSRPTYILTSSSGTVYTSSNGTFMLVVDTDVNIGDTEAIIPIVFSSASDVETFTLTIPNVTF